MKDPRIPWILLLLPLLTNWWVPSSVVLATSNNDSPRDDGHPSEESSHYTYMWNPADEHPCNIPRIPLASLHRHFPPDGIVPPLYPTPFILTLSSSTTNHHNKTHTTKISSPITSNNTHHLRNHLFRHKTALDTILDHFPPNFQVTLTSSNALSEHVRELSLHDYLHETLSKRETLPTVPASDNWYLFGHTFSAEWQNLTQHYALPPCRTCVDDLVALSFGIGNRGSGVQWHTHGPGFSEALHGRKHWLLYDADEGRPAEYHKDQSSRQWMEYVYTKTDTVPRPWECTLNPGDLIYFPDKWWHATVNLDPYTAFISTFTTEHDLDRHSHLLEVVDDNDEL